jgi:site-specific DNA-methyltransferase (adenine-specific)
MNTHPSQALRGLETHMYASVYQTSLGELFKGDCVDFLRDIPDNYVDCLFADPPFNLRKDYGKGIPDDLKAEEYLAWSWLWLSEAVRIVKPGGSLFVFNLPRWLIEYGSFLNHKGMQFRHWIACRMPKAFPRGKKLSPAHYGYSTIRKGSQKHSTRSIFLFQFAGIAVKKFVITEDTGIS